MKMCKADVSQLNLDYSDNSETLLIAQLLIQYVFIGGEEDLVLPPQ